jgi:preprotein translocase subunit SecG
MSMQTVALVILLLLAFALIGVVLLQRNEGGGLGMGGGNMAGGRGQATALQRATWWLGGGFMAMSLVLTVIAAQEAGNASVVDQIQAGGAEEEAPAGLPDLGDGSLLPPPAGGTATDAPLVPAGD